MNLQEKEMMQAVHEEGWATVRDVVRATRFSHCSAKRKLRELEVDGYLDKEKHGVKNKYRVSTSALPAVITEALT